MYEDLWTEVSLEPQELSGTPCWQRECFMPSKLKEWDTSLSPYRGFWEYLPFISSVLVFRNSYFSPVWVSLTVLQLLLCWNGDLRVWLLPPTTLQLSPHPRGAHHTTTSPAPKPITAVSTTTIALGMRICCMTVTPLTPWSLNFRVQVTWKCWRRQIAHMQHFNSPPCATKPQNADPSCIDVSHIRDRFPWGMSSGKKRSYEWQTKPVKAKFTANRVWFFRRGAVKL